MEKEKLESLLIDYIDGKLNDADKKVVEQELVNNAEAYTLYEQLKVVITAMERTANLEPDKGLKRIFDQMIHDEIRMQKSEKANAVIPFFYKVAAVITFLIVALIGGYWIYKDQQHEKQLAEVRKEMEATKQMMMAMMHNDQSASQRLTGVAVAYKFQKADDEIVEVLVKTMNDDPNTNVRMAALEALSKFQEDPAVRKELIKSLTTQTDPNVQIALIQLMVTMKEKSVMKDLERMTKDKTIMKAVKDEAYTGILRLS